MAKCVQYENCHFAHFSLQLGHSLHSPLPTPSPVYFFKMLWFPVETMPPLSRNSQSSLLPPSLLGLRVYFWSLCSHLFLDVSAEKMNLYLSLCVCPIPLIMSDAIQVAAFGRTWSTFLLTSILLYVWTTFCSSVSLLICESDTINLLPWTLILKHLFKTQFLNIFCMHLVGLLVLYNPLLEVCEHHKTLA